jgi:hypothetical protein
VSVIVSVPVVAPDVVGEKVTVTAQEPVAAIELPQLFVSLNGLLA